MSDAASDPLSGSPGAASSGSSGDPAASLPGPAPSPDEERIYRAFVDQVLAGGDPEVPADASSALARRCRLFLLLRRSRSVRLASQSFLGALFEAGLGEGLTLSEGLGGAAPGTGGAESARADDASGGEAPSSDEERYVVESEIGRGGMGRVLLGYDRDFRRRIAMKVLLGDERTGAALEPARVARFLEEAQATAQLEHPNIAPVYDLGVDAEGFPFFTMKWIRGRDLDAILRERDAGRTGSDLSLVRLVQILQQVAMGVDFAHSRGVVHRDLKPQNVMVGDYGEVLVVDWGLAKILGRFRAPATAPETAPDLVEPPTPDSSASQSTLDAVTTDRREAGAVSVDGHVVGSLAYMAPEQARGETDRIDARTDVFGLGGILYTILTASPPYVGESFGEILERVREGRVDPPRDRAPTRVIPEALERVCRRALAPTPEDRHASAREFQDELQAWVEGIHDAERRAREVRSLLERAAEDALELERRSNRLRATRERLQRERERVADHDPVENKRVLWSTEEREGEERDRVDAAFDRTTSAYQAVLRIDPAQPDARGALASLYYERLCDAEARDDREAARVYEALVRQYDVGRYAPLLEAKGHVRIESDPPAERMQLLRYRERGPLLVEELVESIAGGTLERDLPTGSWLAILERSGHASARLPVSVTRGARITCRVRLHALESIPPGFVQVVGGETIVGARSAGALELAHFPLSTEHVGEVFFARFPVTFGEYARFFSERVAELGESDPEVLALWPSFGRQRYLVRDHDGRFVPLAEHGFEERTPVFGISRAAMLSYCAWLSPRVGRTLRLPTELEWERAARGADGRPHPWGRGFDWALCKGGRSRAGQPRPEPVGAFESDVSPFGVRDLAGGVRELCDGWYETGVRPCRGGSWFQTGPNVFRASSRTMLREGSITTDVGFRVVFEA